MISDSGTTGNVVAGDLIGTNAAGSQAIPNLAGVQIYSGASGNSIGGTVAGSRNVVSGNTNAGVDLGQSGTTGNVVLGNDIGTNTAGTAALANFNGLVIEGGASGNTIGGTLASAANVVSGNTDYGVVIANSGTSGNLIVGNFLGTGATGNTAVPNGLDGIAIGNQASGNTVGGAVAGSRNLISGNDYAGVEFGQSGTTGNVVLGNDIGTNAAGTASLANVYGVVIASGSSGNTIGGTSSGAGNLIAFNSQEAVEVVGASAPILENSIFKNGSGIVLSSGGNNNQIAPVITGVTSAATGATSSQTTISVDLTAAGFTSGSTYSLDFFASALGDPASGIQAHISLGTQTFTGGATGNVTFTLPIPLLSANETVTATATLLAGSTFTNTSSFAPAAPVTESSNFIVTTTNATGAGSLEQAILDANADTTNTTPYTVTFVITTGSAPYTINLPSSGLTPIARPVLLDATSQPGYAGSPIIVLDGTGISGSGLLLGTGSGGSLLRGLAIIDFTAAGTAGIDIASGSNAVQATYVGVQTGGRKAAGNTEGILITGSNNTIGGVAPGAGDLISGNTIDGIDISGTGASGNVVEGDDIGTSADGTMALGNGVDDLVLQNRAAGNWIGVNRVNGPDNANQGNVIAGGPSVGVVIEGSGTTDNVVAGNLIGLNVGSQGQVIDGLGDGFAGVWIIAGASGNWIGVNAAGGPGTQDALQRNVISGSDNQVGLANTGTTGNVVAGNLIGTDPTGIAAVPNQTYDAPSSTGVYIADGASSNLVGTTGQDGAGADALERNVISGSTASGVIIVDQGAASTGNVVAGNFIGTTADGSAALGNLLGVVIALGASSNDVGVNSVYGPENADQGNLISGNTYAGVHITSAGTANNVVSGNKIGTDVTGTKALPNAGHGVAIDDGPQGTIIGTSGDGVADALERNLISGNGADGVAIVGSTVETDDNVVAGNYIGTDVTGALPLGNQAQGVVVSGMASFNRIGVNPGDVGAPAEGNLISANQSYGVWIWQGGASSNVVAGNLIGTNAAGTAALANLVGVSISNGAHNNWIGVNPVYGPQNADQGNVIGGNSFAGINIEDSGTTGNVVAGNLIGLNVNSQGQVIDGLGDGNSGVAVFSAASGNWIGVNAASGPGTQNVLQRNVISGTFIGVAMSNTGTTGNVVAGNLIGTDPTGTAPVPNQTKNAPVIWGVAISIGASSNLVGTSGQDGAVADALERNVISGGTEGVYIYGQGFATTGNVVAGNFIGTTADGRTALGNASGVVIAQGASSNWVGVNSVYGPANSDQRNIISGNTEDGVEITDTGTTANTVAGNFIGTGATGTTSIANGAVFVTDSSGNDINGGVLIYNGASANLIGSSGEDGANDALERNVISGNGFTAVVIDGATTTGNVVAGNDLGTTPSGESGLSNGTYGDGVDLVSGAHGNWIGVNSVFGAETADQGNLISGNNGSFSVGIYIDPTSTGNVVAGNLIGTDSSGASSIPNSVNIDIFGPSNLIGTSGQHGAADALERNVISGSSQQGIEITGAAASGNVIAGNLIGTNVAGSAALGNAVEGILIESGASHNWIGVNSVFGSETSDQRNVISGSTDNGIELNGSGTTGNIVAGNFIGTDVTGTKAVPNSIHGVAIYQGPNGNLIGTNGDGVADAMERNLISGNGQDGVAIAGFTVETDNNVVAGNSIGTDVTGTLPLGNEARGVEVVGLASFNRIGVKPGDVGASAEGNLISANQGFGVWIWEEASKNVVAGNLIGTNASGTAALANSVGVFLGDGATANTIGGNLTSAPNVISGNTGDGVEITDSNTTANVVAGNLIGTSPSGSAALGNGAQGVEITGGSSNNLVGGHTAAARNIISGNAVRGVYLNSSGSQNRVQGNYIGTDVTGMVALGNGWDGVSADYSAGNFIGTDGDGVNDATEGNLISGNHNNNIGFFRIGHQE